MTYENEYISYDSITNVVNVKDVIKLFYGEILSRELHGNGVPETLELRNVDKYRIVLPDCMERLSDNAFNSRNMSEINLPNGITYIGDAAFGYCFWLKNIIWPNGTKCIKQYTFYECVRLEEITLPEGLTTICDFAFSNCKSLKNITIPETVQEFGTYVFGGCESLETIEVPRSLYEKYNRNDNYFKRDSSAKVLVYDDSEVASSSEEGSLREDIDWWDDDDDIFDDGEGLSTGEELSNEEILSNENDNTLDDKIRYSLEFEYPTEFHFSLTHLEELCDNIVLRINSNNIHKKAFFQSEKISKIIIENPSDNSHNGLIGESAFRECWDLKKVVISDIIGKIDNYAFYFCGCLKEVHLSAGLKSIGERAFKSCYELEEITIPSTVTELGEGVFEDDSNMKKIIAPKHLIDKYGEEYVRGHCNAEVIAYEVDDSLNVNESLKTASSDNSTETVKSNSGQRRSFNGTIKTNIIASKKNK